MNIIEIKNSFAALAVAINNKKLTADELIKLEERKLILMRQFEDYLTSHYAHLKLKDGKEKTVGATTYLVLKKVFYYVAMILGLIQDAIGNYVFGLSLFSLITFLSPPVVIAASIILTLLNSILFYGFQASLFWDVLELSDPNKEPESLLQNYSQQVAVLNHINHFLFDIKVVARTSASAYRDHAALALLMNQHIATIQKETTDFEEPVLKKILRWSITTIGALTTAAASYFFTTSFLTMIAASLLLNPIGWIIISLMILASVSLYLSMQGSGITNLVSPEYAHHEALKHSLGTCDLKDANDFQLNYEIQDQLATSGFKKPPIAAESKSSSSDCGQIVYPKAQTRFFAIKKTAAECNLSACDQSPTTPNHFGVTV
ncbi:MAG: hypothetical protein ACHP65_09415 [Legionellales bacterium]